jgi:transposase
MSQSRTRCIGLDVQKESLAVASVAQDHGADVPSLGAIGPRQGASDPLTRQLQAQAQPLLFVDAAGPCGYWLSRYLRHKGYDCWGVAPSLLPKKAGDRVKPDRRDAVHRARLMRAGARPHMRQDKV